MLPSLVVSIRRSRPMPTNILMPALSPTMEEGGLTKWLVKEGDKVAAGDLIAEIETDKAVMEVEAADDGRIGKLLVPEGAEGIKVHAVIAILLGEGEEISAAETIAKASPSLMASPTGGEEDQKDAPTRRSPRGEEDGERQKLGEGATPKESTAERSEPGETPPLPTRGVNGEDGDRIFASPLARRLAKEAGLSLAAIHGSGPHGRIVEADIAAVQASGEAKAGAPGTAPPAMSDNEILGLYDPDDYELVLHDHMRRIIAERLTQAKRTIPHFYLTADLEIDALLALRTEINAAATAGEGGKPSYHVSLTDLMIKALALALMEVPAANVTWTESGMLHHKHADIGVAVAIPSGGLITPVMHSADSKRLSEMSNEIKDLVERARERKLLPEEYRGGVTSISNLGMYPIREFAAVINPPQSSILAVGAGEQRPVARKGEIAIATIMTVTLSTDHRAVDGAIGAELLRAFRRHIEKPAGMFV